MVADIPIDGRRPVTRRASALGTPPERAQLAWRRARELADGTNGDEFTFALELLRAAHHSPSAMAHALSLGRTHIRAHPDDRAGLGGVAILDAATRFLGIKPLADDVASARP